MEGFNEYASGTVANRIYGSTPYTFVGPDKWIDKNVFKLITYLGLHTNINCWEAYVYSKILL